MVSLIVLSHGTGDLHFTPHDLFDRTPILPFVGECGRDYSDADCGKFAGFLCIELIKHMNTRQKALFLCCTLLLLLSPTASRAAPIADETTDPYLIIYTAAVIFDGVLDVERGGIFVMKANGTDIRQLTSFQTVNFDFAQHGLNLPDDHPSISPDGKFVAFTSNRDDRNNWEIYVMEINGANPRRLTNNPGLDTEPVWSPDGKRIAFSSERNGQKFNIWTMDSKNGLNLQQVTTNAAEDL